MPLQDVLIEASTSARVSDPDKRPLGSMHHVRLYPYSPNTANLQIRSEGRLSDHATKARQCHSSAHLGVEQAEKLRAALDSWIADQSGGFAVGVTLTGEQVARLLRSAWEGGSNYWASANGRPWRDEGGKLVLSLASPVTVHEHWYKEEAGNTTHTLDLDAIRRGVTLLPTLPHVLADILTGNADAGTGDVFLQLCLFGEVRYS